MSRYICVEGIETLIELEDAPSIELVRCKDCIDNDINLSGTENWCLHFGYDVEDDGFCNYGERVDEPNYYDPALHE